MAINQKTLIFPFFTVREALHDELFSVTRGSEVQLEVISLERGITECKNE